MMKRLAYFVPAGIVLLALASTPLPGASKDGTGDDRSAGAVDLSPAGWDPGELEKVLMLNEVFKIPKPLAFGQKGMVTGTTDAPAIRAGLEALKQGGSAVDAAMTTALTQVTLLGGSTTSFAGILNMVCYEASTGKVFALDAGYNTVQEETDPLTIPTASYADPGRKAGPAPKGRTVLVPGFMAGVEAAHERFGKLPFEALFGPAIYFAEKGFTFTSKLDRYLGHRKEILSRLPETRSVFTREDGAFYAVGDTFKQPALAETLRRVAREGARYVYTGAWAERFVETVRREGGKMTMKDMAGYRVCWQEPLHTTYHGYDLHLCPGAPAFVAMLNLLEAADLAAMGHYSESPEPFFWFTQLGRGVSMMPALLTEADGSGRDAWTSKAIAEKAWAAMKKGTLQGVAALKAKSPGHSAAVVAVDEAGNVAAVLHSINTVVWGENGIFVDGISIPDSATFQQQVIEAVGPGKRLFVNTAPLVVMKEGKPVMGISCIGTGIYVETLKVLLNALDFGMNAKETLDAASFLVPDYGAGGLSDRERVVQGTFSAGLMEKVRALGLELDEIPPEYASRGCGYAVIVTIDPESGRLEGCAPAYSNGAALGY